MQNEKQEKRLMIDLSIFFYRVPEAAKAVSISKSQMWTLIREGVIPSYKMSEKITLVKSSELFQYVESFKVEVNGSK
ncbi:helix-turn-helix domain-containing protein [bacterium]|nr:helix-turn-helix domain-containing protein [bacterium]